MTDLADRSATELRGLIAAKQASVSEVVGACLARVERLNPTLNAIVTLNPRAMDDARDLDRRLARGEDAGLLCGLPVGIKDVTPVAGLRTTFGSRIYADHVPDEDALVVKRLRAAGAVILGKTNCPEFAAGGNTFNEVFGRTRNPWDLSKSAGGSTGGGAAAVAAGMVPIAHGSDIGGSIRIPASWCGGVGLKPSRGRVSFGPALDEGGFGLAMNFVQTRTVRDVAAMLDCLAIPQPGDPFVIPRPAEPYRAFVGKPAPRLRIAWSAKPLMDGPVDPEVAAAVAATARLLAEMGHDVSEDSLPFDGEEASRQMLSLWFFGFDRRLEEIAARLGRTIGPHTLEPVTLKIYEFSKRLDPHGFQEVLGYMNTLRRRIGEFFARHDVWLSPTTALVAEPHGLYNQGRADISAEEYLPFSDRPVQFCFPYNVAGQPAISLPLAWHSSGLPIGVQLGARPAEEHVLIQLAAALEEARPWRNKVPPLHASR